MDYISLTGTQIMAVLNPLLALIEQNIPPEKICLLATHKTMRIAQKIRNYMELGHFPPENIEIHPVADRLEKDGHGPPVQEVMSKIVSNDMAFNLAGGLKFQMAACVQVISGHRCLYMYPESSQIHTIRVEDRCNVERDSLPLPKPIDVLTLQGITTEVLSKKRSCPSFLEKMFRRCNIDLPEGTMKHVRIKSPSLNLPVDFDLIWNTGNELVFLKSIVMDGTSRPTDYYKNEARLIVSVATSRQLFAELFHRKIGVLTNHRQVDARLKEEGAGKVESFFMSNRSPGHSSAEKGLKNFMKPARAPEKADKEFPVEGIDTGNSQPGNTLLITSLGRDVLTTLTALWTHDPDHVCFVYTPGNKAIEKLKNTILDEKKRLPVQNIHFYPADVCGASIMDIELPGYETVMVNITPGTKGHAAFLTLWAQTNRYPVYSLENAASVYEQLPSGNLGNQTLPDLLTYSMIRGARLENPGLGLESVRANHIQHERILEFLRLMDRENVPISKFYFEKIELKKARAKSEPLADNKVRITFPGKKIVFSTRNDEWFEALTGYVMILCGATDLRIRFRSAWPKHIQNRLLANQNIGNKVHQSDVDVIATINSTYYVISCKISDKKTPGKLTLEAAAFASLFGRFAIPMLCFLKYRGDPYNDNNGVYIFGYKTLCDTGSMKALLRQAKAKSSTFKKS